ncbi:response regulator [Deinococcus maricopensis]|uniref:Response regulator receiver protein n=1 Tax=Deinococcus maricopensis (strain DSM 21211 / LMG 22137 / NRRL B-23946 / LB-34) TaxID=709986 RepID=E8U3T4_DEIML|nr:response regulator [Deinococcus maricopensis]ADV68777.1 response regulator receiver protein [Deinococcus maricopensis DSM 21211]
MSATLQVLLVEDNPADVFLTEVAVEEAGVAFTLQVARDGEEALDAVAQGLPDLILLDLNLPRKNGFEVLEAVKGHPEWRRIPVVVLTTSAAASDVRRAYDLHANAYTTKPPGLPEFIDFVQLLERYWGRATRRAGGG